MSCEIEAEIAIAEYGMDNHECIEYKKNNLKLYTLSHELYAKRGRALDEVGSPECIPF